MRLLRVFGGIMLLTVVFLWGTRTWTDGQSGLITFWEGLWGDVNFRDAGLSLNQCLGYDSFHPGIVGRASRYFSGWSCAEVGKPDRIVTLNFRPKDAFAYYCRDDFGGKVVGVHYNESFEFSDIEAVDQWQRPEFRAAICQTLDKIFDEVGAGRRVLIHCDAGRDRTGTVVTIVAAAAAQARGLDMDAVTRAIECDYRKSRSLVPEKYGRMSLFLRSLGPDGMLGFLERQCSIPRAKISRAAAAWAA